MTPLLRGSKQDLRRRRLKSEWPFTHSVQQNPHSGTEDAVAPPPTSMGRRHINRKGWSIRTVQSGSRQLIACSFRSIRGTVASQHVNGFLMVCRSVRTEQNA